MANAKLQTGHEVHIANEAFVRVKYIVNNTLKGIRGAKNLIGAVGS